MSSGALDCSVWSVIVSIDGSDLAAERFEGPSVYAGELLPRLSHVLAGRGHAVTTYLPGPPRGVALAGEVRVIPGRPFWTQRVLARSLLRAKPDALFLPIQMLPLRRPKDMATVAVVHDLEFLRYPRTYTMKNLLLLHLFTRHAVRNATGLIAVSHYTKDEVVRVYGRPADRITVVHHGVALQPPPHARTQDLRRTFGLPDRFLLFVGSFQPRKNIAGLVKAYELLSAEVSAAPDLVLAGGGGWKEWSVRGRVSASRCVDRIHVLRKVSKEDLTALYRAAEVFILPSFSEGFGLTALEAMAAGTPVVCSNTSALPEVVGDAALLVPPRDPAAIARAIRRLLDDAPLRARLGERGAARAASFSWETAAAETADVIEHVLTAR